MEGIALTVQDRILIVPAAITAAPILWLMLCTLISHLTGWRGLAQEYRQSEPFTGERWRFNWGSSYFDRGRRPRK